MIKGDLEDIISDVVSEEQIKKCNCFIPYFYLKKVYFYQDEQIVRGEGGKLLFLNPDLDRSKMRDRYICMRVDIEGKYVECYGTCSVESLLKQEWREDAEREEAEVPQNDL